MIRFGKQSSVVKAVNVHHNRRDPAKKNTLRNPAAAGLHICTENRWRGEGRGGGGVGCGVWDSKQVCWRAEGWLVKGRLLALTSPPPPPPPPFIPSVLPAPMSPLGSLMDADSNGCPPSPNPSPPPPPPPSALLLLYPLRPLSFALPPRSCPFSTDHSDLALEVAVLWLGSELLGGQNV